MPTAKLQRLCIMSQACDCTFSTLADSCLAGKPTYNQKMLWHKPHTAIEAGLLCHAEASVSDTPTMTLRGFTYQAVGQLAQRTPQLFQNDTDIAAQFFSALSVEPPGVRAALQEAVSTLALAYKGCSGMPSLSPSGAAFFVAPCPRLLWRQTRSTPFCTPFRVSGSVPAKIKGLACPEVCFGTKLTWKQLLNPRVCLLCR